MTKARRILERAPLMGRRRWLLGGCLLAGLLAAWFLDLDPGTLLRRAHWDTIEKFLRAVATPALAYEEDVPGGNTFLEDLASGALKTFIYAAAAMGLALLLSVPLGLSGTASLWTHRSGWGRRLGTLLFFSARGLMALLRSVHELIWAMVFLTAFGLAPVNAVIAIAIPYGATLGKVFSELVDEAPQGAAEAFRATGGSPLQVCLFGALPSVMPDLLAYALYRFECGIRSAAVLGFFGVPTLGYYLKLSWGEQHYHEVWSYLYALLLMIILLEFWSNLIRKRLTVRAET